MPTETLSARGVIGSRRWLPEALLAALAFAAFLGCLGSLELWGKREQRASAEALDTYNHQNWLVAEIQGRPRLEKPPLPRWSIATLMVLTGRRDEWIVRLPGALAGLGTVAIIYFLGRRIGGRSVALASALVLCSLGFFVGEMRQASNDGLLTFFTTLALYASWRCLHDDLWITHVALVSDSSTTRTWWKLVLFIALGLGFLSKGPVILLLTSITVIPYLILAGEPIRGLRRLIDLRGLLIFIVLGLSWPVAVLLRDPDAARIWSLEMSEKTGVSQIFPHERHGVLLERWPALVLPWSLIAIVAALSPCILLIARARRGRNEQSIDPEFADDLWTSALWFPWWWGMGNLAMFCFWAVAKPSYYLPCLPGMAVLIGSTWVRLARSARVEGRIGLFARVVLQAQWVTVFVAAVVAPVALRPWIPVSVWPWSIAIGAAVSGASAASVVAWRRGAEAMTLAPLSTAYVAGMLIVYGIIAPVENPLHSHRSLAKSLPRLLPGGVHKVMFYNEIDEGLWFYLNGVELVPVPGCHPQHNSAYDLVEGTRAKGLPAESVGLLEAKRRVHDKQALLDWLDKPDASNGYLLIRNSTYQRLAGEIAGRAVPLFRETGLKRNELVLLQGTARQPNSAIATTPDAMRR